MQKGQALAHTHIYTYTHVGAYTHTHITKLSSCPIIILFVIHYISLDDIFYSQFTLRLFPSLKANGHILILVARIYAAIKMKHSLQHRMWYIVVKYHLTGKCKALSFTKRDFFNEDGKFCITLNNALEISCRSLVDRCGSFGSYKPQI
jgi:hypothetical protein